MLFIKMKKNGTFQVADPAMNFILLRANRDLRHLAVYLGEDIDELDSWISQQGLKKIGNFMVAQYNSPWALPPFRHNEIMVRISK